MTNATTWQYRQYISRKTIYSSAKPPFSKWQLLSTPQGLSLEMFTFTKKHQGYLSSLLYSTILTQLWWRSSKTCYWKTDPSAWQPIHMRTAGCNHLFHVRTSVLLRRQPPTPASADSSNIKGYNSPTIQERNEMSTMRDTRACKESNPHPSRHQTGKHRHRSRLGTNQKSSYYSHSAPP